MRPWFGIMAPMTRMGLIVAMLVAGGFAATAQAQPAFPFADARVEPTRLGFAELVARLERAIEANGMRLVARASASVGASERGIAIPGNAVIMVFRNDFALRMLEASLAAGIEAPIRFYVTENPDRTATLSWRPPTAVFAPYRSAPLDAVARELDPIFARIAADAVGR